MAIINISHGSYMSVSKWFGPDGEVYSTLRAGDGNTAHDYTGFSPSVWIQGCSDPYQPKFSINKRTVFGFTTSGLAGQILGSGQIEIVVASKSNDLGLSDANAGICLVGCTLQNHTLTLTKYNLVNLDLTLMSDTVFNYSQCAGTLTFPLNANGIASINTAGITCFAILMRIDANAGSPTWSYNQSSVVFTATANYPKLTITTVEDPPESPTLLTSSCVSGIGESDVAGAPTASASADVVSGSAPLTVNFSDRSGMTPTSWLWEFGDGTTSASQNPSHTYTTAGTYSVRLTATNAQGSTSYQMTIVVLDAAVVTPPANGVVVPVGSLPGASLQSLLGKIGYFAVDSDNHQVKIHGLDGAVLKTFGGVGTAAGKFYMPTTCSVINGRQLLDKVTIIEE